MPGPVEAEAVATAGTVAAKTEPVAAIRVGKTMVGAVTMGAVTMGAVTVGAVTVGAVGGPAAGTGAVMTMGGYTSSSDSVVPYKSPSLSLSGC